MFDPTAVVREFVSGGVTHVVWVPDSSLGPWETALQSSPDIQLIRPTREGEAIAIAAGLMLGRAKPLVIVQCTGLFEAGDALRNVVHDLQLPLKMIVGIRSYQNFLAGKGSDNCPTFTEPIIQAWQVPYRLLPTPTFESFAEGVREMMATPTAFALLLGE
jgi:sulfopyruvate decarboxylase TPP-binding subunit